MPLSRVNELCFKGWKQNASGAGKQNLSFSNSPSVRCGSWSSMFFQLGPAWLCIGCWLLPAAATCWKRGIHCLDEGEKLWLVSVLLLTEEEALSPREHP